VTGAAPVREELVLAVGCSMRVETPAPIGAVVQVAPAPNPGLGVRREEWNTTARHHTYVDRYDNRCERFSIGAGVTELVCVTDGRMSGTEGGPTALHVTPEAAVGGPIGFVRDGDEIVLDAITGRLDLLVDDQELARRAAEVSPRASTPLRGYERLHVEHVLQADQGCDLDFLVDYDSHPHSGDLRVPSDLSATPAAAKEIQR